VADCELPAMVGAAGRIGCVASVTPQAPKLSSRPIAMPVWNKKRAIIYLYRCMSSLVNRTYAVVSLAFGRVVIFLPYIVFAPLGENDVWKMEGTSLLQAMNHFQALTAYDA